MIYMHTLPLLLLQDSRVSVPLAMLRRDFGAHLDTLLPGGVGQSFEIPLRAQFRWV